MSNRPVPAALRTLVRERANGRCEYCQTPEWLSGLPGEIDHITLRAHGGETTLDNLCFACAACNGRKQAKLSGVDPHTGQEHRLFHPRIQLWQEHFAWNPDGTQIVGLTPIGRATVEALHLNHDLVVVARSLWVRIGHHPPE